MSDVVTTILFVVLGLAVPILITGVFYLVLGLTSRKMERQHELDLTQREAAVAGFPITDLHQDPLAADASAGQLVSGSVVMGTGARRQFTASIRAVVGGEIKGYQRVIQAARREALLRMTETAVAQGARAVINVRFETSKVGNPQNPSSEILCYGTMIK